MKRHWLYTTILAVMAPATISLAQGSVARVGTIAEVRYLSGVDIQVSDSIQASIVLPRIQKGTINEPKARQPLPSPSTKFFVTFRF